ncbi:MAG TPA: UDP-N-acetylmuramoyl-L-alanine--D-glutamate ligase [Pirellulales bacterium]|nr:UDP-N-acetylmuramoyl-L-alanine--D-glutamate ligase [Pirellulales bacterium]
MELAGRRVTVMGLGRHGGGVAAARWLAERGAIVTVTDLADERTLSDSIAELAGVSIAAWHLAGHRDADFTEADLVVVNPAVRPDNRFVAAAHAANVPTTLEIELFLGCCRGRVIGVTGSNGKSTTAAMIAEILAADGRRNWFGGNIGRSLLADLDAITAADWVVLELSSFQLARLSRGVRWPEMAVVTNCTANHLDWHGSMEAYASAKQRLLLEQSACGVAVLNGGDPIVRSWHQLARGQVLMVDGDNDVPELKLPGEHNRRNAACAAAAARRAGCSPDAIRRGLESFRGLPHRLELVAEIDGRRFYNDSMATTPESVMAAVDTFANKPWLLVGGHDKGFDFAPLAAKLARQARGVACYGAVRERMMTMIEDQPAPRCRCESFVELADALQWCWLQSRAEEVIVLSPACASYDQFRDYRHRGETFAILARALAQRGAPAR